MTREELTDILTLRSIDGLSHRWVGRLIREAGSPAAVFSVPQAELASWGLKREVIAGIRNRIISTETIAEADFVEKNGIRAVGFWEKEYPILLTECPDAPVMLFGRGSFDFSEAPIAVSIVGTRSITPYGVSMTAEIVRALAPYNPVIVSGLAHGVDGEAHRAALQCGLRTVGVLGQGLGTALYPSENRGTAQLMCHTEGCGILTEYLHRQAALPALFPARNRIVAGISRATIVVEAKAKAGALITAELASGYNREVFAVPGRVIDPCSAGCNALIRRNKAIMADDPQVIVEELGLALKTLENGRKNASPAKSGPGSLPKLSGNEKAVAQTLAPVEKMHVDELCNLLSMPVYELSALLLEMELTGTVESLPGKYYSLSPALRAEDSLFS